MNRRSFWIAPVMLAMLLVGSALADAPKTVLLLGAKRDHPPGRHQYMAGLRIIAKCLQDVPGIQTRIVAADEPWKEGPELLAKADAILLNLGAGAKWMHGSPERLAAIKALAARRGGIVALHWSIGTKEAEYIEPLRSIVGGCHGGPDRRYIVTKGDLHVVDREHPIVRGVEDLSIRDEFYYKLKFASQGKITPILDVPLEGNREVVAWAFERPDGGRSFGFSGMDPHESWKQVAYRRLAAQAVLWTLDLPVPKGGLPVEITDADLRLEPGE